ncbi:TPA: hypothetical protein ACUNF5_004187 [Burkholderia orbicola]|uniref:hypothetical protein n=1 Tax=Burkholderia cenocepacia TaxID=95486 RepID=UPI00163A89DB|nr:hypothetical protein [Burkholderia cenocepacia]
MFRMLQQSSFPAGGGKNDCAHAVDGLLVRVASTWPTNRTALPWRNVCALFRVRQDVGAAIADRRVARRAGHSSVSVVSVREHGERH